MKKLLVLFSFAALTLSTASNAATTGCSASAGSATQPPLSLPPLQLLSTALSADTGVADKASVKHLADNLNLGQLFQEDAGTLVDRTVCSQKSCSADSGSYVLINVVSWRSAAAFTSSWYIYRGGKSKLSPWSNADFQTNNRLYGAKHTYLLSIQVSPAAVPQPPAYTVNENQRVSTNMQDLNALVGGLTGGAPFASAGVAWTGNELARRYPGEADICISSTIPQPVAAAVNHNDDNSNGNAPVAAPAQPVTAPAPVTPVTAAGNAPPSPTPPSLSAPAGGSGSGVPVPTPPVTGSAAPGGISSSAPAAPVPTNVAMADYSVTDEPKQWWDVSIAVPISKISDVQYSSTAGTVTPNTVNRQTVFAMLDLYLPKKDLVGMKYSLIPHPLIGVSMGSKPLQSLLFAGAVGFSFGELYVGANLLKQPTLGNGLSAGSAATAAQVAAATGTSFQPHFSVGINLSVKSAFTAIKSATSK